MHAGARELRIAGVRPPLLEAHGLELGPGDLIAGDSRNRHAKRARLTGDPNHALEKLAGVVVVPGMSSPECDTEKAMLAKKNMLKILYAPAAVVVLSVLYFFIAQPAATSGVNTFFNIAFGLFIAAYLGLTAVSMVHSFVKASASEREANGLNFMLFGTVVGLAPIVISAIVGLISPKAVLPGNQYYFLAMVLIPISIGLATMKTEGSAAPKEEADKEAVPVD